MQETEAAASVIKLRRYLIPLSRHGGYFYDQLNMELAERGFETRLKSDFDKIWEKTLGGDLRLVLFYDPHSPTPVMSRERREAATAYHIDLLSAKGMSSEAISEVAEKTISGELGDLFEIAHPISTTR